MWCIRERIASRTKLSRRGSRKNLRTPRRESRRNRTRLDEDPQRPADAGLCAFGPLTPKVRGDMPRIPEVRRRELHGSDLRFSAPGLGASGVVRFCSALTPAWVATSQTARMRLVATGELQAGFIGSPTVPNDVSCGRAREPSVNCASTGWCLVTFATKAATSVTCAQVILRMRTGVPPLPRTRGC
jgi:hypothetical protein